MKNIFYTFFALAATVIFAGCLPEKAEDALVYKGPTVVEVKNHTLGVIDTALNRRGVYTCTAQNDSSRTVNQDAINFRATSATTNVLSCVAAGNTSYRLVANPALAANARGTDSILVQLVGPQRSTPTVINYAVRPASTAVEGVHYDFATPGARSVTIPANSSAAYILVNIKKGLTTAGSATSVRLIIDVLGNANTPVSTNYSKFLLTIRKNF